MNLPRKPLFRRATTALLLCALALPAFASKELPVIGFTMDSFDIPRWQRDRDTFVRAVEKAGGKVIVQSANSDDAVQISNIRSFIARHVDVIVVVPHNAAALSAAINDASAAHIPVVAYDRFIANADIACFVGFDNRQVGELQAGYVAARLPGDHKARIVRIEGAPTDPNATDFKAGQDKVLEPLLKSGKVEIVYEDWAKDWSPDAGKEIMRAAIAKARLPFDAVIATNDGLAGAAVDVLADAKATVPIITGQDADRSALARIKEGTQSMTVYKPVDKLAVLAAEVAVGFAHGQPPETKSTINNGTKAVPSFIYPVEAIDQSNLASILTGASVK
jgi:D-xylose transport system substrate-binding protein